MDDIYINPMYFQSCGHISLVGRLHLQAPLASSCFPGSGLAPIIK